MAKTAQLINKIVQLKRKPIILARGTIKLAIS
jgi:hypothetical protein